MKLPYLIALRPRQWTKNLIIFAAPLFAFDITIQSFLGSLLAFSLFCATSSSFYLFNDIADVSSDRQHPVKSQRPIAAGLIPIPVAITLAIALLSISIVLAWLKTPLLGIVILSYAILQVAYNLRLKKTVILDVMTIATGFVLRACAGGIVNNITLSPWFLICTAMLALFLGIEKRKAELRLINVKKMQTRSVLKRYSLPLLTRMENVITSGTIITYSLWSSGPQVNGASTPWMLLTLPFVIYGVFRYQLLSDSKEIIRRKNANNSKDIHTERPEEVLLNDLPILLTLICWIITIFMILYLKNQGFIQ